jgi:hypothetical protein
MLNEIIKAQQSVRHNIKNPQHEFLKLRGLVQNHRINTIFQILTNMLAPAIKYYVKTPVAGPFTVVL